MALLLIAQRALHRRRTESRLSDSSSSRSALCIVAGQNPGQLPSRQQQLFHADNKVVGEFPQVGHQFRTGNEPDVQLAVE
jgi:hypothetical protein